MKKIYLILFSLVALSGSGVKAQETAETVDVTYTYTLDGQTLGTRTVTETVGEAPADQASIPTYVTATGYPTTIGESTTSYTISTSYNNNMPFGVSTDGCRFYYTINFGSSGTYYWRTVYGGNKSEQSSGTPADRFTNPVYRWSIEGDWFNGFLLRNNDGKYITAPDGDFAATTEYYVTFWERGYGALALPHDGQRQLLALQSQGCQPRDIPGPYQLHRTENQLVLQR